MRVIGVDMPSKRDFVLGLGAEHFVDASGKDLGQEVKKITGGMGASAVVVCAASNESYASAPGMLKRGGTIVCVGMPEGEAEGIKGLGPTQMVANLLTVTSTAVGNRRDAVEVLDMAARGLVETKVEVVKMEELENVFKRMEEGKLLGRVVLDLS